MNGSSNQCSTSTIERACILHNDTYEIANQPIHEITDYIQQKICESSLNRKSKPNFKDSMYPSIVLNLPEKPSALHGYHSTCYQLITNGKLLEHKSQDENSAIVTSGIQIIPYYIYYIII